MKLCWIFFFLVFIASACSHSTKSSPSVPNFRLLDHQGTFHTLYQQHDAKAVVLIWQGNGCPIFRLGLSEIRRLKTKYADKGVHFFLVNSNPQDSLADIQQEAREYDLPFPILKDQLQSVAHELNVTRTAETIVLTPRNWKVIYRGALDDSLGYESQRKARRHFLDEALTNVLAGDPVALPATEVKGCLINFTSDS